MSKLSMLEERIQGLSNYECGAVGCKEWCVLNTDWCKDHQHKENEEVGFLLPQKIAEAYLKHYPLTYE